MRNILLLIISITLSLMIFEGGLRVFLAERLAEVPRNEESLFWQKHPTLGWERIPQTNGEFTNGLFSGHVTTGEMGIRSNGSEWLRGAATIFFIGDSTVASLEVDDNETVPAQLERMLRDGGHHVNVANLGVRGYGTDQAVTAALRAAQKIHPNAVIYMYMDNDVFNNNTIKNPLRVFGKSVYLRGADGVFIARNSPVPDYAFNYAGFVYLDTVCKPHVVEGLIDQTKMMRSRFFSGRVWNHVKTHIYIARLFDVLRERWNRMVESPNKDRDQDLDVAIANGELLWNQDLESLYDDTGVIRERCNDYFIDQMSFLLGRLRSIPELDAVFAVEWPYFAARKYHDDNKTAPPSELMLNTLVNRGVLNGIVLLNEIGRKDGVDFRQFSCPGDSHLCE